MITHLKISIDKREWKIDFVPFTAAWNRVFVVDVAFDLMVLDWNPVWNMFHWYWSGTSVVRNVIVIFFGQHNIPAIR